jgi:Leucine rich repeat
MYRKLKCSRCDLIRVFSAISNTGLTHIDADHNQLQVDLVGTLPSSLQQLNLSYNLFSTLPPSVPSLVNLITLDISYNKLESIQGISQLTALTDLNLDGNLLVEVTSEVAQVIKLKRLSVRRNKIGVKAVTFEGQSIHVDVFVSSSIDSMSLDGNSLTKADIMRFEGISAFIERRRRQKDKTLLMGATTDFDFFGLE